jgi:membrane-bound serine protease (ClpP class)
MILVLAVLLALFVLESPWNVVAIVGAGAIETLEVVVFVRWSQRRRVQVGAETLVGETAEVVTPLRPDGQVRLHGELWRASCAEGALPGELVRVTAVDGLTLEVERR